MTIESRLKKIISPLVIRYNIYNLEYINLNNHILLAYLYLNTYIRYNLPNLITVLCPYSYLLLITSITFL